MLKALRPALVIFILLTVITGVLYPGLVTVAGNLLFADEAQGSLVERDGKVAGSKLLGQPFSSPDYFWSRPSATSPAYNGAASAGSNLATTNPKQSDALKERIAALRAADPGNALPVPADLVTASGSGLDPHISPEAAEYQVGRVARARGVDARVVRALVDSATEGRTFGVLGEPRVNVLELNLALDAQVN
jgi:potassium-transporting ATPase KdpC subunit